VPAAPRRLDPIDHLLALDPGGRGIAGFFQPGGALAAARALARARSVLIVTGFIVAEGMPETDGPPGAAVLGRALRRLGAGVRYTTDAATLPTLAAALKALGEPVEAFAYPDTADAAAEVLARERPTHLVSIERPGRGHGGDYLNARGVSVRPWNRPLDDMFLLARRITGRAGKTGVSVPRPSHHRPPSFRAGRAPLATIGIGDGGNEIGMGNVRGALAREGALMARIASVVRVDHLVVAGVSNWGAYGIVAQLGRLTGGSLLHSPDDERRLIDACVAAGAVDGITRRAERTVDGLDADTHAAIVALLGLSWGHVLRPGERG
jgi:D-glutamate cyclase-like protein